MQNSNIAVEYQVGILRSSFKLKSGMIPQMASWPRTYFAICPATLAMASPHCEA